MPRLNISRRWFAVGLLFSGYGFTGAVHGQAPAISGTSPQAVAPGSIVDVAIRGGNLSGAKVVWTSFDARTAITPDIADNGTRNDTVTWRFVVPPDASLGVHGIRMATDKGVSPLRLFVVDDLPSIPAAAENSSFAAAQELKPPVAVDGLVSARTRHYFRFHAVAGQQLSVEVLARRIGSALDPMIRVLDPTGRELTYTDDTPGLGGDPQLSWTFASEGDYLIELRDIRYTGGAQHHYRLRLGDFPCVNVPYPMGARRGAETTLTFAGTQVAGTQPLTVRIPNDPSIEWFNVGVRRAGGDSSGFATLSVGSREELAEVEPNDQPDQSGRAELGSQLNGRLNRSGDTDRFVLAAKKGQHFEFRAITREQGSPADLVLKLISPDGKVVAQSEDKGTLDSSFRYRFATDGDYTLLVEDLHRRGGNQYAYRIAVDEVEPRFALSASTDTLNIPAGGTAMLTVNAVRTDFNDPIHLTLADLPAGVDAPSAVIGSGLKSVVMTMSCSPAAPTGIAMPIRIIGRGRIGDRTIESTATITTALKAAANDMPWPPGVLETSVAVGIAPEAAIRLKAEPATITFGRHLKATVKVMADRREGYDADITLAVTPDKNGLPAGITAAVKPIAKGTNEIEIEFTATEKAPLGEFTAVLTGTVKKDKETVTQVVPGIGMLLRSAFDIRVEPAAEKLGKGGEVHFKVIIDRNPAYAGPVNVTLQNLPTGITADPIEIPADAETVEVVLRAAADAVAASVMNIVARAEASVGDKKLQHDSPPVALTIE